MPDDGDPQRRFQRVSLVTLRVVLPQSGGVGEQGEPRRPAAASKGLGGAGERRRRLVGQVQGIGSGQSVVLVEDGSLEARVGQGPPVETGDVADGEVREQQRGGGGGLVFLSFF